LSGSFEVSCPADYKVVGGGGFVPGGEIQASFPEFGTSGENDGWEVWFTNPDDNA